MKKNWLSKTLYYFTHDLNSFKTIVTMIVVAGLAWAVPIIYTGANPERYMIGDFERWEVWWAIIGGIIGMAPGLIIKAIDSNRKEKT